MSDRNKHIIIIEPSQIIYDGLSNILLKLDQHSVIYRYEYLSQVSEIKTEIKPDYILINPSCVVPELKLFGNLKKKYDKSFWIAIIYSFYEKNIISKFDGIIEISASVEDIKKIFDNIETSNNSDDDNISSDNLSSREIDVLIELVKGLSNKEIADKLNISTHTVISHRKNITSKTGIKSLSGLTIYAITQKIINIDDA